MDIAAEVQESWGNTSPRVRGEILRKAWELLIERRDDFALLMTIEMGKPFAEAQGEVTYGGEFLRWFAEEAVRVMLRRYADERQQGRFKIYSGNHERGEVRALG